MDEDKPRAAEMFKMVSMVYSILSDDRRKALYDVKGIIDGDAMNNYVINEERMDTIKNQFAGKL